MFRFVFLFFIFTFYNFNICAEALNTSSKTPNAYFKDNYGPSSNQASFKAYGLWSIIDVKDKDFAELPVNPATNKPYLSNPQEFQSLVDYGYGISLAFTTFITKYIGIEIGACGLFYKINKDELSTIQHNYTNQDGPNNVAPNPNNGGQNTAAQSSNTSPITGKNSYKISDNDQIYSIPVHLSFQYHFAPEGGIRPYMGAGYHMNYTYSPFPEFDIDIMYGPMIQAGVDFVGKDDTIYTVEIKKYFAIDSKINYKNDFVQTSNSKGFSTKADFSPLIVSLGIGFKF